MKNITRSLSFMVLLSVAVACGNQNGVTPLKDTTTDPSPVLTPSDTAHSDTMINNGERLQGTDTSGRRP